MRIFLIELFKTDAHNQDFGFEASESHRVFYFFSCITYRAKDDFDNDIEVFPVRKSSKSSFLNLMLAESLVFIIFHHNAERLPVFMISLILGKGWRTGGLLQIRGD